MEYDLRGEGGNVFAVIGFVRGRLLKDGQREKANEFQKRVHKGMDDGSLDYDQILELAEEYIEGLSFIR